MSCAKIKEWRDGHEVGSGGSHYVRYRSSFRGNCEFHRGGTSMVIGAFVGAIDRKTVEAKYSFTLAGVAS